MNRIVKRGLFYGTLAAGAFLTFRLLDLLMAWGIYSWFFGNLQNMAGLPDTLNGAISLWLTVVTMLLIPTFLSALFFRRTTKKVIIIASAVSSWLVIMYFLAQPKQGHYFNPMTGQAMYRYYKAQDDRIELLPLGYKFHPRYGTQLLPLTPEVIQQMDEQKAKELEQQKLKDEEQQRIREQEEQKAREKELEQQRQRSELEQRTKDLERQKAELEQRNSEAEQKARELAERLAAEQARAREQGKQVNSTERQGGNIVRPLRAQDTGLLAKGHQILTDDLESSVNLANLDFSYCPVRGDENSIDSDTMFKRAKEVGAIGSLGLGKLVLDAEKEGKNIIPPDLRTDIDKGGVVILLPRTIALSEDSGREVYVLGWYYGGWFVGYHGAGFSHFNRSFRFIRLRK